MADSVVLSVVSKLLRRITYPLTFQVGYWRDDYYYASGDGSYHVSALQKELMWIHTFLEDADAVRLKEGEKRLQDLLSQFRDITNDAEDVIDNFILDAPTCITYMDGFCETLSSPPRIDETKCSEKIEAISSRLSKIRESYPTYGVQKVAGTKTNNRQPRPGWSRYYAHEEEDVVGLDDDIKNLVAELTNTMGSARVVSIAGIGGSGKTTLARKLYNHVDIKKHFDCRAWASISQEGRARDLLINIITQTTSPSNKDRNIKKMSNKELVKEVHNFFKEKKFLLVLDDVWENEAWDELRPAFPSENGGSKLIITTRIQNVALHADPNCFVHEPRSLTDEEAWKLLFKNVKDVIRDDRRKEPSRFHKLGKKMVKKCRGLPLAIVVLGGLLTTKTSLEEWEKVSQNINLNLRKTGKEGTQQHREVSKVLALSYDNLPYYLKPCFLYLGMFPKNSEIRVKSLIRMWIAEGFISPPQIWIGEGFISSSQIYTKETLQQEGEKYFQELIQRNLIQVVENGTIGRPESCLMHDLLRELCLDKAREERFLEVLSSSKSTKTIATQASVSKARRIAVYFGDDNTRSLLRLNNSCIRSLLCFGSALYLSESELNTLRTNLPLARVIHVDGAYMFFHKRFAKHIENLFHLKYFNNKYFHKEERETASGRYTPELEREEDKPHDLQIENVAEVFPQTMHHWRGTYEIEEISCSSERSFSSRSNQSFRSTTEISKYAQLAGQVKRQCEIEELPCSSERTSMDH